MADHGILDLHFLKIDNMMNVGSIVEKLDWNDACKAKPFDLQHKWIGCSMMLIGG